MNFFHTWNIIAEVTVHNLYDIDPQLKVYM